MSPTSTASDTPYLSASATSTPPSELSDYEGSQHQFGTRAIHIGSEPSFHNAVIPPISLSTTFKQDTIGDGKYEYSRSANPTREAFERAVASLEKGKHGLAFSSGSAVTASIVSSLPSGSHIISVNDVYGGTYRYFTKVASTHGIDTSFVDLHDPENIQGFFRENTKLVWIETPTNPTLRLVDIEAVAQAAHKHGALLVVDNTFMSPYFQNPLTLGADVVVHSVTKYINGHSDVVMGVLVTNDSSLASRFAFIQNSFGAVPSAFDSWLALRGLKTLHLRMRQHAQNAAAVAQLLVHHPAVIDVIYPGLESHPQHDLAKRQARGFGGMLSFRIKGGAKGAEKFLAESHIFTLAESLGGVESLAEVPARMTHASVALEERIKLGITDDLIRLSLGVEETDDILTDVTHALDSVQAEFPSKQ